MPNRVRKLGRTLAIGVRGLLVVLRALWLYQYFRLKLWWWKRRSRRSFARMLRDLPPELRHELEEEYGVFVKNRARLPGFLELPRLLLRWRGGRVTGILPWGGHVGGKRRKDTE